MSLKYIDTISTEELLKIISGIKERKTPREQLEFFEQLMTYANVERNNILKAITTKSEITKDN